MRRLLMYFVMALGCVVLTAHGHVPREAGGDSAACAKDTLMMVRMYRHDVSDSLLSKQGRGYTKEDFQFRYDPFLEKMKEPWLGDLLKDILF